MPLAVSALTLPPGMPDAVLATPRPVRREVPDVQIKIALMNGRCLLFSSGAAPEILARLLPVLDTR